MILGSLKCSLSVYLDWHWAIVGHMDSHRNLLLNWVWLWHFVGHLHDLLNFIGHMLDHRIGLRHLDFHGHMNVFLDRHMNNLFDGHWHWHLLDHRQCLLLVDGEVRHMMVMVILIVMQTSFRLCGIIADCLLGLLFSRLNLFLSHGTLLLLGLCIAGSQQQHQSDCCRDTL